MAKAPGKSVIGSVKPRRFAEITAVAPLATSMTNTKIPLSLDISFQTFVAPAWCDPTAKISTPFIYESK